MVHRATWLSLAVSLALGCAPATRMPELVDSTPAGGAIDVPRTTWPVLRFAEPVVPEALRDVHLWCADRAVEIDVQALADARVVVNPAGELSPGSTCELAWAGPHGDERLFFRVAEAGEPAPVTCDRDSNASAAPFPDDFWLRDDPKVPGRKRVVLAFNGRSEVIRSLLVPFAEAASDLDGFSPLGPMVVEVPAALDASSLPMTLAESLDALATVALVDIDRDGPSFGERVPFQIVLRDQDNADGSPGHQLLLIPDVALRAKGRYALIITRRALVNAARPLEPSAFLSAALGPESGRATVAQRRLGALLEPALSALAEGAPRLHADDLALLAVVSIRSMDGMERDLLSVRTQLQSLPRPGFEISSIWPSVAGDVAAVVHGTFDAHQWRDGDYLARETDGTPRYVGTAPIEFTLALPRAALFGPVPILMFQTGYPGNAHDNVPQFAGMGLAEAGFAVIGFNDVQNRQRLSGGDLGPAAGYITFLQKKRLPETTELLTHADQLTFLRFLPNLRGLDLLPVGSTDGVPELDVDAPLSYLGISFGTVQGIGFLPYAPEIRSAVLAVGGSPYVDCNIHQDLVSGKPEGYLSLASFFSGLTRTDYFVGLSLTQMLMDNQDSGNSTPFLYRRPLGLSGSALPTSVLMVEGINDSYIAPYQTDIAVKGYGIPAVGPLHRPVPGLAVATLPLRGNMMGGQATAGLYQFVPDGVSGLSATPGCYGVWAEGHFCAQASPEAIAQQVHFFTTGLTGVPEIIDPLGK